MLLLRGKDSKSPFTLLVLAILLFGRKKNEPEEAPAAQALSREQFPVPDVLKKTVTGQDVGKARDHLRIAGLERDIISGAMTTIYEAEAKGHINEGERNQLVQRYKVDLKRIDSEIETFKNVVDLHELESAKEDLLKSFQEKLLEIDERINKIKPFLTQLPEMEARTPPPTTTPPKPDETNTPANPPANKEKAPPKERAKNKAEERLDAIREEVLKAMERLEQIETEG
jgi:hypothetical protein